MACVDNIAPMNVDSEMEEGEIVDDLSDISSEEEFLLRQRLEVLENYNNVLERKKAKHSSVRPGTKHKKEDALSYDLSEISATDLEDYCSPYKNIKVQKHQKTHHRQKRKKEDPEITRSKEHKKKNSRPKKKVEVKVISESSEESDDEYRNRRKKLADAVVVNKTTNDKTSLSERLQKMLWGVNPEPMRFLLSNNKPNTFIVNNGVKSPPKSTPILPSRNNDFLNLDTQNAIQENKIACEIIDICTDEDTKTNNILHSVDTVDSVVKEKDHGIDIQKMLDKGKVSEKDSDDDLELLRAHALKTKAVKTKNVGNDDTLVPSENKILSEDEDSDTTELRLICLKSALLKKAIEMKRKQKLQKKLSQSSNLHDDSLSVEQILLAEKINSDNNTDIESVDMDIGSDGDDKLKENDGNRNGTIEQHVIDNLQKDIPVLMVSKEDELEEDEDLLRAKLLTSLSKNLPNLVNPKIIESKEKVPETEVTTPKQPQPSAIPEEKRFIISVESDSEGENEATKNLTKMHMKLSEQVDFQQKLDIFLKSTRMEVEKTTLPDVVQQPVPPKKNEKYVVKAVKNLPKSEQIEYKNLVKRMAELEKIKQARQSAINLNNKLSVPIKDTLKPRNVTLDASNLSAIDTLEEKIKNSRKNIAEESAKMLKLKEEGTKLSQKFKIVATELRNLKTAIALNKKQQGTVQNYLAKIRLHHQMLLKSSLTSTHSKANAISHFNHVNLRLQKENNPKDQTLQTHKEVPKENAKTSGMVKDVPKDNNKITKESNKNLPVHKEAPKDYKNPAKQKAIKIGFINDLNQAEPEKLKSSVIQNPRLSIEIDVTSNKKVVKVPERDENTGKSKESRNESGDLLENKRHTSHPIVEKGGGSKDVPRGPRRRDSDDYRSPLDAFGSITWEEDPNAILCPFEVCGDCKDADCKYLHTNSRSK